MNKHMQKGFTIFELLVALGIFGILMTLVIQFQVRGNQISTQLGVESEQIEDIRNAAAIITDEVQRAYYVFPPCGVYSSNPNSIPILKSCDITTAFPTGYQPTKMNVNFSKFNFGSGNTVYNPLALITGVSGIWEVGSANNPPILAMIVAPRESDPANITCGGTRPSGEKARACYQFVAYFPVKREYVSVGLKGNPSTYPAYAEKLDDVAAWRNQWVLMEYRENLDDYIGAQTGQTVAGVGTGLSFPVVNWGNANCGVGYICSNGSTSEPTPDPRTSVQLSSNALPAISRGNIIATELASFVSRMNSTVAVIGGISSNILLDNVEPNQFKIDFPALSAASPLPTICVTVPTDSSCFQGYNSVDERGVTEVRISLQGSRILDSSGAKVLIPTKPLQTYATLRNLPQ
jgi:prepilin-type N-terminal cleavage/methylation domain-containing protein